MRELFVDETAWWDQVAMGVDMLERGTVLERKKFDFEGRGIEWVGNVPPPGSEKKAVAASESVAVKAHVFRRVENPEILRRLSQMPDETPADMLKETFAVFCPDIAAFVSINDDDFQLLRYIEKLRGENS